MKICAKCKKESYLLREFTSTEPSKLCPECEKVWLKVFMNTFPNYNSIYPSSKEWAVAWLDWLGIRLTPIKVVFT